MFCGSCKVLTKVAHVEWRTVSWRWQNRFPSTANPTRTLSGDFAAAERRAGRSARELSRGDQECIFTCRPATPANISPAWKADGYPPGKHVQPRDVARKDQRVAIPRFRCFSHISIILTRDSLDVRRNIFVQIMSHSGIGGAEKKQRTNDLPRVSQLRFKSLPNTYLKQTNAHIEINQNITTLSLVFSYCYLSCRFHLLLTNSRKPPMKLFPFHFREREV